MTRATLNSVLLLVLTLSLVLLAACNTAEQEATLEPSPTEITPTSTPEPEVSTPGVVMTPEEGEVGPEETAEAKETPSDSGLMAVIVSGDTAGIGKPFTFDATRSRAGEAAIVNYVWNMGDGTTLFGISVEHAYSELGFYTVTLLVTDAVGETDTAAIVVEVVELDQLMTPTAEGELTLVGTSWVLSNAMRGTVISLAFEEEALSGSAGCNDYVATHTIAFVEGSTWAISISSIGTTGDSCTPEVMAQERGYLDSLATARSITIDGNRLIMETGSGTLIFSEASS